MKKFVLIGVTSLSVVMLAGCQRFKTAPAEVTTASVESLPEESDVIPENLGIVPDLGSKALTGGYMEYDPNTIADLARKGKTVLFFFSSSSPDSKVISDDINSQIFLIPAGVNIIIVDFDQETELKQKYGITSVNSFVLLDENLQSVEKWTGGKLDQILSKVQ